VIVVGETGSGKTTQLTQVCCALRSMSVLTVFAIYYNSLLSLYHPLGGHVMPNEDEYQNSVQLTFRYCLGVS